MYSTNQADSEVGFVRRLRSLDALRGYSMLVLIAGPLLLRGLRPFADCWSVESLMQQLSHSPWHGVTYLDLGFPGFVTVMGMSLSLSFARRDGDIHTGLQAIARMARRSVILFALGIVYGGGFKTTWPNIRWTGVLQRLSVCYFVSALAHLYLSLRQQIVFLAVLLLGYWALLTLVPVPGYGRGDLSFEGNVVAYIDRLYLPGRPYFGDGQWDPEGVLSTLGAIASCVLGVVIGVTILKAHVTARSRLCRLGIVGFVLVDAGYLWSFWLPLNKPLWTPSFVIFAAGIATLHMACFYLIADLWHRNWCWPLEIIGMNPLAAYCLVGLIPMNDLATRLVGCDLQRALGSWGPMSVSLTELMLYWLALNWLYKRGIAIKA